MDRRDYCTSTRFSEATGRRKKQQKQCQQIKAISFEENMRITFGYWKTHQIVREDIKAYIVIQLMQKLRKFLAIIRNMFVFIALCTLYRVLRRNG